MNLRSAERRSPSLEGDGLLADSSRLPFFSRDSAIPCEWTQPPAAMAAKVDPCESRPSMPLPETAVCIRTQKERTERRALFAGSAITRLAESAFQLVRPRR